MILPNHSIDIYWYVPMIFIIIQQNFKWFSNVWVSKLLLKSLSWGEPHRPSDGGWGGAGCPRCPRCWKCRWWLSPGAKWGEALASWDCWWISDRDPWANSIHWYLKQIANESVGPRISEICRNGTLQRRWIPCRHFVCTSAKTGVGVPDVYRFHTWLQTFDDRGTPGPRGPRMPRDFLTQLETRDLQGSEDSWSGLAKFSCLSMLRASFKDQLSSWVCSKMHHIIIELQKQLLYNYMYYYILLYINSYCFLSFQIPSQVTPLLRLLAVRMYGWSGNPWAMASLWMQGITVIVVILWVTFLILWVKSPYISLIHLFSCWKLQKTFRILSEIHLNHPKSTCFL